MIKHHYDIFRPDKANMPLSHDTCVPCWYIKTYPISITDVPNTIKAIKSVHKKAKTFFLSNLFSTS